MKKLALIDVAGIFHSAWAATADLEFGEAFERTIRKVNQLAHGYDHVAITYDWGPYFRLSISPTYKAHREKLSEMFYEQYRRTRDRLVRDGFYVLGVKGFESDDCIATIVNQLRGQYEITIFSADKDLAVLVDDENKIRLVSHQTGSVLDEAATRAKFGVNPADITDFLALCGDKADNIPGVPDVGPARAAKIINSPAGFEGALRGEPIEVDGLTPRILDIVKQHAPTVRIAKQLVTLRTDVPLDVAEIFKERKPQPLTKQKAETSADSAESETLTDKITEAEFVDEKPKSEAVKTESPATQTEPKAAIVRAAPPPVEWALELEPRDGRAAMALAESLLESRLFPQFKNREAILAVILRGRSLGIDAGTSLSTFHVIGGKATLPAALIVGLVQRSGKAEYFDLVETTNDKATWVTKRKGSKHEVSLSWDCEDAANAGFLVRDGAKYKAKDSSSNWDKYRRTMLRWRAACELARAVYADVVSGLYSPDEMSDGAELPGDVDIKAVAQ